MSETGTVKKRIDSIDILRAFGILIMVMGHVGFGGKFDRYIHTFHMPIFFMISGYLYRSKNDNIFSLLWNKVKRLLIPYLFYAGVNYFIWFLLYRDSGKKLTEPIFKLFTYNTEGLPICGALWFLTALFWTEIIYILVDRIIKNGTLRSIVIAAVAISASIFFNHSSYRLPLSVDVSLVCLGFYELGRTYKCIKEKADCIFASGKYRIWWVAAVLLVVNAALAFVNDYVNIKSAWYGNVILFWINAVIGSLAYMLIAKGTDKILAGNSIIRTCLVDIGRTSMVFLGLNQAVILLTNMTLDCLGLQLLPIIYAIIIFVISTGILYLLSRMVNKVHAKLILLFLGI